MKKKSIFFLLLAACSSHAKVLIFTCAFNRPDFIEIQHKTFQKFIEDDYEFVVFNDASNHNAEQHIKNMCDKYDIECIRIPPEIHNKPYLPRWPGENYHAPAVRNVNAVMYSLNTRGFDHDDILVMLESDVFLVKPINISQLMQHYDIAGRFITPSKRIGWIGEITYLWHGLAFLNLKTMPNKRTITFNCGRVDNTPVDAGGQSYYYLRNNPEIKLFSFDHVFSNELKCDSCKNTNTPTCIHNTQELAKTGLDEHQITFFQVCT